MLSIDHTDLTSVTPSHHSPLRPVPTTHLYLPNRVGSRGRSGSGFDDRSTGADEEPQGTERRVETDKEEAKEPTEEQEVSNGVHS